MSSQPRSPTLATLVAYALSEHRQAALDEADAKSHGSFTWRHRKRAEAHDLLALEEIAGGRLHVDHLDLSTELHAVVRLSVPVPTLPGRDGEIVVEQGAVLGLTWPDQVLSARLPGTAFVQILAPSHVFHSNVLSGPVQALCLGVEMPVGIKVTELVIASYRAISLQDVQADPEHAAGVLDHRAAEFWSRNPSRMPLTTDPFLMPEATEAGS